MPIHIRGTVIGVIQMINKKSVEGMFTRVKTEFENCIHKPTFLSFQQDEESFKTFAIYCGLALHHAKLYDKIRRSEQKYKVLS